ncbi:hypothetical protein [Paenirhodobacter populi]|uniref:Uncharacterized protein n=1 Tax=Paenirhodobacter populi TaxID=2306993 RepID=A0A443JRG8_9RHOB|nr:hypothetical protein [Sinirhodobacter populi]RWR23079.1 hypothetical protein D2T30_05510 [Sinirhodobacter populi]
MMRFIVEVVALVSWDDLDPYDIDIEGNCAVDGAWLVGATDAEAALDRFHDKVAIAFLEDFLISVRPYGSQDSFSSFRDVL